jgi:molecular chaperone IbpA|tara:strand:- start:1218 stop:1613 length:396 start_codon:yes stop_codon:yes gene_type:complete
MTLDLTPFRHFTVGFDSLFDELENYKPINYPPYNISKIKDGEYKVEMAVAGFTKQDITVTVKENILAVKGKKEKSESDFLYKGIGERSFSQNFRLAEFMYIDKAELKDGILRITLKQELPEEKKEKTIKIT